MKVTSVPSNLLRNAIVAAGHAHTMGAEGQNVEMSLGGEDESLFSYNSTYAVSASRESQTITVTTLGAATYGEATIPADVEADGAFSFNPVTLGIGTLLRTYGRAPIRIVHADNGVLSIYCGSSACESSFSNLGKPVTVSPQEMGETTCEVTIPSDVFFPSVSTVLPFAISPKDPAKILHSVHLYETSSGAVKIVAADRKRVARTGLEVHSQTGSLGDGVTISVRVMSAYVGAIAQLLTKDDLLSAKTILTVGQQGRYFLCAESADGKTKLCLQYASIHGEYPKLAKARFCQGEPTHKVIIKSIKALSESFTPVAAWASSCGETMFAMQIEPNLIRFAFQSGRGAFMHSSISATSAVKSAVQVALNAKHVNELIASIKDAGEATVIINLWQKEGKFDAVFGLLTNPSFEHYTPGMIPAPGVDIASWFEIAAPLRQKPEKESVKSRGTAAAEAEAPAAAKPPAARRTAKKGKATTATAAAAAAAKTGKAAIAKPPATPAAAKTAKPPTAAANAATAKPPTAAKSPATKPETQLPLEVEVIVVADPAANPK